MMMRMSGRQLMNHFKYRIMLELTKNYLVKGTVFEATSYKGTRISSSISAKESRLADAIFRSERLNLLNDQKSNYYGVKQPNAVTFFQRALVSLLHAQNAKSKVEQPPLSRKSIL